MKKNNWIINLALLWCLLWVTASHATAPDIPTFRLSEIDGVDISDRLAYFSLEKGPLPETAAALPVWLASLPPHYDTNHFGDRYIAVLRLQNDTEQPFIFVYPYGSVIDSIRLKSFAETGTQEVVSGYRHANAVDFHYGGELHIAPGNSATLVLLFESDYFFAPIKILIGPSAAMQDQLSHENLVLLVSLGVCFALALYNFFIFIGSGERLYLYYALATFSFAWGWSHVFGVPEYLLHRQFPMFLMPPYLIGAMFTSFFVMEFLQLPKRSPRLTLILKGNAVFCAIGAIIAAYTPALGLLLATLGTSIVLILGLYGGVLSWRRGFRPARYFVLAFASVVLPNMVGNLMNLGLLPGLNVNIYLLGLLGNTSDSLLLAFALAEKVRLINAKNRVLTAELEQKVVALNELNSNLERKVEERTADLHISLIEQQAILDNAMTGIAFIRDGKIMRCNNGFEQIFGYSQAELVGQSTSIIHESETAFERLRQDAHASMFGGEPYHADVRLRHKDGHLLWCEVKAKWLGPQDNQQSMVLVAQDISDRKNAETALLEAKAKAEEAAQAKSSFLAKMSHEIRTPINAVIGLSRLATKTPLNEEQQDYLHKIQEAGEVLLGLVNDILDVSKVEANKLSLEMTTFSLSKLVQRAVNINALRAHGKGLEIVTDIELGIPPHLIGDPLRIQQILVNLINNAVKFTDHGVICIQVRCIHQQETDIRLAFSIIDSGIGMSPAQQAKLFQPFSQADDSMTRKYGGTGLGLTICKQLCELMGGEIWVESEVGKGSTFHFTIDLSVADQATPAVRLDRSRLSATKTLVVDDIPLARRVLAEMLKELGIDCHQAQNGEEAITMVQAASRDAAPYDLILMDWRMPGMDGIEASKRIKSLNLCNSPHILMVSAYDRQEARRRDDSHIIEQFLEKPVNLSMLVDAIMSVIVNDPQRLSADGPSVDQVPDLSSYHLLLVEDNAINRQVAEGFLRDSGIQITTAENGLEALSKLQECAFDIILMDIQMPEMDGLTAARLVRHQLMLDTPIIAMTAHVMESDVQKSRDAGMNDHICKPLDPDTLYGVLTQYLKPAAQSLQAVPPQHASHLDMKRLGELPELDAGQALRNLSGKQALYASLLRDFMQEHRQSVELFTTLVNQQDWPSLFRHIHTLKSTALYIGAFPLSKACARLEQLLDSGSFQQPLMDDINDRLSRLISGLSQVLPQAVTAIDIDLTPTRLKQSVQKILPLLLRSDLSVEDAVPMLTKLSELPQYGPMINTLIEYIREVEFEQASQLAQRLLADLEGQPDNAS